MENSARTEGRDEAPYKVACTRDSLRLAAGGTNPERAYAAAGVPVPEPIAVVEESITKPDEYLEQKMITGGTLP